VGDALAGEGGDHVTAHVGQRAERGQPRLLRGAVGPNRNDRDALGQLSYKVWYYPSLQYDEDQRNNTINARRQRVQLLLARWRQATSWFNPELLRVPRETVAS